VYSTTMTGLSARSRIVGYAIVGMHANRSDPKRAEGLAVWNSWRVKDVMIPQSGSGVEYMYVGHVVVMSNMLPNASVGMAGMCCDQRCNRYHSTLFARK